MVAALLEAIGALADRADLSEDEREAATTHQGSGTGCRLQPAGVRAGDLDAAHAAAALVKPRLAHGLHAVACSQLL